MKIVCLDLEGVLIPEIWIRVAEATGVSELRVTTRDIEDYDELMRYRLGILDKNRITLAAIQAVIAGMEPLPGAVDFLQELRAARQAVILSDTYIEFMPGVLKQLHYPLILCNELVTDERGMVVDYRLRQPDGKREAVAAFRSLNLQTIAVGDSFNDISMIRTADVGILFRPSDKVREVNPDLMVAHDHNELLQEILGI
jgi:phosphoserine/homoserine phosphotransferase